MGLKEFIGQRTQVKKDLMSHCCIKEGVKEL